jgi:Flp pilus assembly pilin Flp
MASRRNSSRANIERLNGHITGPAGTTVQAGPNERMDTIRGERVMERDVELFDRVVREEEGQDLVEYAILLAFIALACVVAVTALGTSISGVLGKVGNGVDGLLDLVP